MVKRDKSPDIPDDAKYLAVYLPYPLNANFELPGDYIAFALWIATVLGSPESILGIHHKPKARSMVILEVERKARLDALLGEHRWNEVLENSRPEEEERISQVFYCIYKTTREAQKDGWKRIHVETEWFVDKGWSLETGPFKRPYPATHWCPPLAEDPTNKNIARPLPVKVKPPPLASPAMVPGSAEWVTAVQEGKPTAGQKKKAWASRKRAGANIIPQRPSIPTEVHNAVASSSTVTKTSNPWLRAVASPASPGGAYFAPPGLTRQVTGPAGDSEDEQPPLSSLGDDDDDDESDGEGYVVPYTETTAGDKEEGGPVNLWADWKAVDKDKEEEETPLCTVHGKLCKKGICAERKRLERETKRAEETAAREAHAKEKKEKRRRRGKEVV